MAFLVTLQSMLWVSVNEVQERLVVDLNSFMDEPLPLHLQTPYLLLLAPIPSWPNTVQFCITPGVTR